MYQLQAGLFTAPWLLTSFYDTAPLRATLAELVDPHRLDSDDPRVVVGATNVGTGEMEFFGGGRPGGLTFEHVAASGSLPPSFPMTGIADQWYWDGGLFSNTPLSPAIDALEQAAGGDPGVERELIVVELFPMRAALPRSMDDVFQRMVQLQYTSRLKLDASFFDTVGSVVDLMARGRRRAARGSTLRDDPTYRSLCAHRQIDHLNVVTSSLPPELSQRVRLLPLVGRGAHPGRLRRRHRPGHRQPHRAGAAVRYDRSPGAGGVLTARSAGRGHAAGGVDGASPAGSRGQPSSSQVTRRSPSREAPSARPS
jgi:hypothetical protein